MLEKKTQKQVQFISQEWDKIMGNIFLCSVMLPGKP